LPVHRKESKHVHYHEGKAYDEEKSRLLGVKKLNPVWMYQNDDDPAPPEWHNVKEGEDLPARKRSWLRRNPMHNLTFYVLGVSDRDFIRYGMNADSIFPPEQKNGVNFSIIKCGPFIYLPSMGFRAEWLEGYLGWRTNGAMGFTMRKNKSGKG